jgi:hypothetical protein
MVTFHGGGREHMSPLAIQFTLKSILFLFFWYQKILFKLASFVKFTLEKPKFPKKILVFLSKNGEILPK